MKGKSTPGVVKLFLGVVLLFNGILAWMILGQLRVEYLFVQTPGTVVTTTVETVRAVGASRWDRCPKILFNYSVEGRSLESDEFRYGGFCTSDTQSATSAFAEFPAGSPVTVYYNPRDPRRGLSSPRSGSHRVLRPIVLPTVQPLCPRLDPRDCLAAAPR